MNKNKNLRKIIFSILTIGSYCLSIIYLFGLHDILGSIACILINFIFFHFLFIDIKEYGRQYIITILICAILIEIGCFMILGREINVRIILALIGYNGAIGALYFSLKMIDFDSISYFTRGGYIFTLFITITYSIAFVGMFKEFPFTCQGLNDASNKLFEFVEKPFYIFKGEKNNGNKLQEILKDMDNNNQKNLKEKSTNPIISKFNEFKDTTINQIMADKTEYDDGMCDLLLNEINLKLEQNGIKRSVILLSYFLLYGFIRIAFFVMSGIAFILFKILYRFKVYHIKKETKKVDEIY